MSLDGLVLVIAIFAVALKLYLWFSEEGVVRGDIEPVLSKLAFLIGRFG